MAKKKKHPMGMLRDKVKLPLEIIHTLLHLLPQFLISKVFYQQYTQFLGHFVGYPSKVEILKDILKPIYITLYKVLCYMEFLSLFILRWWRRFEQNRFYPYKSINNYGYPNRCPFNCHCFSNFCALLRF